jgi:serine/threonine protein kinase
MKRAKDGGGFEYFAAKHYNVGENRDSLQAFHDYMNVLVLLSHAHVMPIVGVIEPTKAHGPIIVTVYSECGSLADILDRVYRNDPSEFFGNAAKLRMIVSLVSGFVYLHSHGVIHHEVKPSDMIVDSDGSIQISDYATSILEEHRYTRALQVGAPSYIAPDVYEDLCIGQKVRDPKMDVFSFTLILYELLFQKRVFSPTLSAARIMRQAMSTRLQDRPAISDEIHPVLRDMIRQGWAPAMAKRKDFEWMWKQL